MSKWVYYILGIFGVYYALTDTTAGLGSRLCSESEEDAKHLATHFADKLRAVMVIEKK